MDRNDAKRIHEQLAALVKTGVEALGLEYRKSHLSYDAAGLITLKFEMVSPSADGETPFHKYFRDFAKVYGYEAEWLGRSFTVGRLTYIVNGFDPKRRSKPIMLACSDGRAKICSVDQFVWLIGTNRPVKKEDAA